MKRYQRHNPEAGSMPASVLTPTREAPEFRWADLLRTAVSEPGTIARCYSVFWSYSLGNQLAALQQCTARGIQPSPINTY
jgi:hypothetical protein